MFRRILGVIILLVSLITAALLLGGAYFAGQAVDSVGEAVDNVITLTVDSLSTVSATLEQTKATIAEANNSIETAVALTDNLSKTVADTQPVMESMTSVVSEDIPDNIEAIQTALPNVAEVAGVVDTAMTKLSSFGISQVIPIPFNPITLDFDLGIEYEPEEPFDETILSLGDSLEGMPEELRSLQGDLTVLSDDLDIVSADILAASGDIAALNEQVAQFIPILDDYLRIVGEIDAALVRVQTQLLAQLDTVKTIAIVTLVFLALTQLAPLYLGWELVSGQRGGKQQEAPVAEETTPMPPAKVEQDPPPPPAEEVVTKAPPETVGEKADQDSPQQVGQASYDPVSDTMIEGPYIDPSETIVEDSPPADDDQS